MVSARQVINSTKPNIIRAPRGPTKLGSAGYDNPRDDIEKTKALREGSVEKVPVNNNDIVNKAYADSINFWQRVGTILSPKNSGDDITTTGDIKNNADNAIHYFGAADDATISFTGSDLKLRSNAITATDGLILQQKAVCVSTDGTTPTDNYQFKIKMDADTPRGLFIDGATNDYTGAVGSYGIYVDREYNWGTGAIGYMKGMYFDIEHKSSNAKISAFTQNNAMQLRISNAGTTNNNTATNVNYYDDLMTNEFYGSTQVVDTSSTGKITYYQRGNLINFVQAPTLTDTGGNSPASIMYRYGQQIHKETIQRTWPRTRHSRR